MMSASISLAQLAGLPFASQIEQINLWLGWADGQTTVTSSAGQDARASVEALLVTLAGFPDHEPLAYAIRVLAEQGEDSLQPEIQRALVEVLCELPDTGVRRVLRGLERLVLPQEILVHLAAIVLEVMTQWDIERIAVICLADRWLKNAAPQERQVWINETLEAMRVCIRACRVGDILDRQLLHLPGKELAAFAALAQESGSLEAWEARLAAFAGLVLALMRRSPRSLSQANAEELLSRRVYTDPGHFLIELFQNAEDAHASRFSVVLEPTQASVCHDGVPFDAKDVVGVLSIGQTTKAREQIGFFGVGFKSVYEICERPQIYSDLFCFEIADISIPRGLAMDELRADGETLLRLPYRSDADALSPSVAQGTLQEMFQRALAVPPETLLTLRHLRSFAVACGDQQRTVLRRPTDHPQVIELWIDETQESRLYRVATGRFVYDGAQRELSRAMQTEMLLAIAIDEDGRPHALSATQPTLFSHLPTEERSGLRMMLHAHFELPVDRERLDLSSPWNRWALAKAGELIATCIAQLCEEVAQGDIISQQTLRGILTILPLPSEIRHSAYQGLLDNLEIGLAALPLLPAAARGGWLRPAQARLLDEAALLSVLSGVALDEEGAQICAWMSGRDKEVALFLGATSLQISELIGLLQQHLAGHRSGTPWPTQWLTTGHRVLFDALGKMLDLAQPGAFSMASWETQHPVESAFLTTLASLPLLPDQQGLPRRPGELWRGDAALRKLYGPHRAFLHEELVHAATSAEMAFLRALPIEVIGPQELLVDLEDAIMAGQILTHAGALALHGYLAQLEPGNTEHLGLLPLFPLEAGGASGTNEGPLVRPIDGDVDTKAWLVPDKGFWSWLQTLEGGCPAMVSSALCAAHGPYLQRLGGEILDLRALLGLLNKGLISLTVADIEGLHLYLEANAAELTPRLCQELAASALFLDVDGMLRPLLGDERALVPVDDDILAFAPEAPWLALHLRGYSYVQRLPVALVGPRMIIRLLCEEQPGPLYTPGDPDALRRAYRYLLQQRGDLLPKELIPLSKAPIWLDLEGQSHALPSLQCWEDDPEVGYLFLRFGQLVPIEDEGEPSALAVAQGLGLGESLVRPDLALLLEQLPKWLDNAPSDADPFIDAMMFKELRKSLARAIEALPVKQLVPLLDMPLFIPIGGGFLPMGDWASWQSSDAIARVYRATPALAPLLGQSRFPILSRDEDAFWHRLFERLAIAAPDIGVLVSILEDDPQLEPAQVHGMARAAFVALGKEIPTDEAFRKRLSTLPIWPSDEGALLPSSQVLMPQEIKRLLGKDLHEAILEREYALLSQDAWADAEILAEAFAFQAPIGHLLSLLETELLPGAPLSAQPFPFFQLDILLELLALLCEYHGDGDGHAAVLSLPLSVNIDQCLCQGPLWHVTGDALVLARALPLRDELALPVWAEAAAKISPHLLNPMPPARLLRELIQAARDAEASKETKTLDALYEEHTLGRWLAVHLDDFAGDPQLHGALGNAPLLKTAAGDYKSPRSLLWMLPDALATSLGLDPWRCHEHISQPLQRALQRHYQLEDAALDRLIGVLAEAHLEAQSQEDAARSQAILQAIAEALPFSDGPAQIEAAPGDDPAMDAASQPWVERLVKRHKLARLRVQTTDGSFERIARLIFPPPAHQPLLDGFLATPMRQIHARYDTPALRCFFASLGAPAHLPAAQLKALLQGRGLAGGLDAQLALAQYLAHLIEHTPRYASILSLREAAWVPDGDGASHAPKALYWPSPESSALLGDAPQLYPHPAFFRTVPPQIAEALPFRRAPKARLQDVLAHLYTSQSGASFEQLQWLEQCLRDKDIPAEQVQEAFGMAPYLRDDNGVLRLPSALICTSAAPWIGEARHVWSDGLRFSKLAATLGIPHRVGPVEILAYGREIAALFERLGPEALLLEIPALQERLPRCLALLGQRNAPPFGAMPLWVEGLDGNRRLTTAADPALALPAPLWLVEVARQQQLPLWLPVMLPDAEEASMAWLRTCGVVGLDAVMAPKGATKPSNAQASDMTHPGQSARSSGPGQADAGSAIDLMAPGTGETADTTRGRRTGDVKDESTRRSASSSDQDERDQDERSMWSRLKGWWERRDEHEERPAARDLDPRQQRPSARETEVGLPSSSWGETGRGPQPQRPTPEVHGGWFRARPTIDPQLTNDGLQWLSDRTQAPHFGFAFAPTSLPYPHAYAPQLIAEQFHRQTQRWGAAAISRLWRQPAASGGFEVAIKGDIPAGENLFPLPLYATLTDVDAEGVRVIKANNGQIFLMARAATSLSCRIVLDRAPVFTGIDIDETSALLDDEASNSSGLLASFVPDQELPPEVLDWVDSMLDRSESWLERALAVRGFIQEHYQYDPSYIEDPAVADWLARISRGRANMHIAALHAGRDHTTLGRGVCYELAALACELMRRLGVPAAVSTGWTWERGQLADADHMWAMALLPSDVGLRWLPIDPATTREGRPLRVANRPQGHWDVKAPTQREQRPAEPSWGKQHPPRERPQGRDPDDEYDDQRDTHRDEQHNDDRPSPPRERPGHPERDEHDERDEQTRRPARNDSSQSRRPSPPAKGQGASSGSRPGRGVIQRRPPVAELIRVLRHIQRMSGEIPDESRELQEICEAVLQDPRTARRLLKWLEQL